jgi:hypothetical protein
MVRSLVEAMLGEAGRQILYFYEAHALPINMVVLTYGLIMLMSWVTTIRVYRYLVVAVARQIHLHPDLNRKSTAKRIRDSLEIPWQEAVDAAPFPLVASQVALIPTRKSVIAIQRLFDEREMIQHAQEVLKGADPRKVRPSYRRMLAKEIAKRDGDGSGDG